MKQRLLSFFCAICLLLLTPALLLARPPTPDKDILDGRLEGYAKGGQPVNVTLEGGSTALTWLLLVFLAAIAVAVLFKNAKRTHLD
jgi:hypothetical protein